MGVRPHRSHARVRLPRLAGSTPACSPSNQTASMPVCVRDWAERVDVVGVGKSNHGRRHLASGQFVFYAIRSELHVTNVFLDAWRSIMSFARSA